jgi:hypothetical protein
VNIRQYFVDECRSWYKYFSNQLALVFGLFMTWAVSHPESIVDYANAIPQPWRIFATFALTGLFPIVVRMLKQKKLIHDA